MEVKHPIPRRNFLFRFFACLLGHSWKFYSNCIMVHGSNTVEGGVWQCKTCGAWSYQHYYFYTDSPTYGRRCPYNE